MSEGSTCKHCHKMYITADNDDNYCSFECWEADNCQSTKAIKKDIFDIQIPLVVKTLKTA